MNEIFYRILVENIEDTTDFSIRDGETGELKEVGSMIEDDFVISVDQKSGLIKLRIGENHELFKAFDEMGTFTLFLEDVADQYALEVNEPHSNNLEELVKAQKEFIEILKNQQNELMGVINKLLGESKGPLDVDRVTEGLTKKANKYESDIMLFADLD